MLLHDAVTCFLFFGYLFSNFLPVGTLVCILHDICDVPFAFSKGIHSTIYEEWAAGPFILGQLTWVYFRMYCLPVIIYTISLQEYAPDRSQFNPFYTINIMFLSTLFAMHILWFYMFQRINYNIIFDVKITADTYIINSPENNKSQTSQTKVEK